MLRTAIDIKDALDSAPSRLTPIGTCEQTYLEWKADNYGGGFPNFPHKNYEFYIMNDKFYYWRNKYQEYCEYTGNEAQSENQDSIYLSRAVIII